MVSRVKPFVGTPALGDALNRASRDVTVTFSDGRTMSFISESDAQFWADFTGRTIAS